MKFSIDSTWIRGWRFSLLDGNPLHLHLHPSTLDRSGTSSTIFDLISPHLIFNRDILLFIHSFIYSSMLITSSPAISFFTQHRSLWAYCEPLACVLWSFHQSRNRVLVAARQYTLVEGQNFVENMLNSNFYTRRRSNWKFPCCSEWTLVKRLLAYPNGSSRS